MDRALDNVEQAIDCITYTLKDMPGINGELISKLQNIANELDDLMHEDIFKPEKIDNTIKSKEITDKMITQLNFHLENLNNPMRFDFVKAKPNEHRSYAVCKIYNEWFAAPHTVTMSAYFITFLEKYFKENFNLRIGVNKNGNTIYSVEV